MLNDIRLHLDSDESRQHAHELVLTRSIDALQDANTKAFNQYIPSIGQMLPRLPFDRLSIFADKHSQSNIVDFNTGKTLYASNPDEQIKTQVSSWAYHSALLDFSSLAQSSIKKEKLDCDFETAKQSAESLCKNLNVEGADTLVLLGLGKGTQLDYFFSDTNEPGSFNHKRIKHLVIYEPDWEIFRCSLGMFNWAEFFEKAQVRNLQIFLQIGNDLSQVYEDINELHHRLGASKILFFKHLNLPIYCSIVDKIKLNRWSKALYEVSDIQSHNQHFLHVFSAVQSEKWSSVDKQNPLFVKNMELFNTYYPDIYEVYKDYQAQVWDVITHRKSKHINLYNRKFKNYFSADDPVKEAYGLSRHFAQYPNLDGLVFGYNGDKLKHYSHNSFIRQTDMILREIEQQASELPQNVKCLLVFGLGSGYQLSHLYQQKNIENLVICEPNPDMFYAALHAIDWSPIFKAIEENNFQLYINIGEASSALFRDLMSQFLQIGPHILNETYIMQAYHNPMLDQVLTEVRQQLRVIFSMGENFDHVAYGLAHTSRALADKVPAMRYQASQYLSYENKQMPIFIVGNGPSLDDSIAIIKEHRENVIVVSCGTALQALYKNGITPDFHGEVEQNRANYDWASRINDKAYLKKITLLSVNGIHPDTYGLYKNVLFAFKSGESSTQAILATLPKNSFHCLHHAYPTVTNMVMSFFLSLGFEQLYLVGVDLGFVDQDKHHSQSSGYYENGKQLYDYKAVHAADLRVRGNRCDWVFTKTEFNISRMIIEQLLRDPNSSPSKQVECFNLSNGVFIDGTISLLPEHVLIMTSNEDKRSVMKSLDSCFMSLGSDIYALIEKAYKRDILNQQIQALYTLSQRKISSKASVNELIEDCANLLYEVRVTGKSLFFYYFFNSLNFLTAALNKASLQSNDTRAVEDCRQILSLWQVFLNDATRFTANNWELLDCSEAYSDKREQFLLEHVEKISYVCLREDVKSAISSFLDSRSLPIQLVDELQVKNRKLIVDIYTQDELLKVAQTLDGHCKTENPSKDIQNVALVFHEFSLIDYFYLQFKNISEHVCVIYTSPCVHLLGRDKDIENGQRDAISLEQYLHILASRGQDIGVFSKIIVKPRFNKLGLKNAYLDDENQKQPLTHSTTNDNEFKSFACDYIKRQILPSLTTQPCYMFKHYIGYMQGINFADKEAMTIVDSLENRGLRIERPLLAHELLGQWQDTALD